MAAYYIKLELEDLDNCYVYFEEHIKMSKLIIEIVGNKVRNFPLLCEETSKKIYELYTKLSQVHPNTDVQINIEFLKGKTPTKIFGSKELNIITILNNLKSHKINDNAKTRTEFKTYKNVVLGGTFDRLHVGHKILLTEAVLRCEEKLTVGVTDESMIKGKKLWELIEPVDLRIENVLNFLKNVDGHLVYEVVPISDMFGPTQTDPDLDMLVVSAETLKGGHKVNEVRCAKGFNKLDLHSVDLVQAHEADEGDEEKVSSSNRRLRLLGTRLGLPEVTPNLPNRPYIIGLTGVIASGKSSVGSVLAEKGAAVIDCDKIAHTLYKKNTSTYKAVLEAFGTSVIACDGEINRAALGAIVFNSKEKLNQLNNLLWPAILDASLEESMRLYKEEKKEIVVLEAAVLLQAGWYNQVHEVWTCIIPPKEAIARVVERNKLSESEAQARINAQPSSIELVSISTVVFSTLYSHDFTKAQVNRAWTSLLQYLKEVTVSDAKL